MGPNRAADAGGSPYLQGGTDATTGRRGLGQQGEFSIVKAPKEKASRETAKETTTTTTA